MKRINQFFIKLLFCSCLFSLSGCRFSLREFPVVPDNIPPQLISYEIVTNPLKTDYLVGEIFNPEGLSISLNWDNNKKQTIKGEDISFPLDPLKLKNKDITGIYKEEEITIPINVIGIDGYAINVGSTSIGLRNFNQKYNNQKSYVSYLNNKETLVIELHGDTSINDASGTFNFTNYGDVVFKGDGALSLLFNGNNDGINANNMTIEDGVTINLNGSNNESGIKVLENLNIKGALNISHFAYAQAIAKREDGISATPIYTRVFSSGKYHIDNCANGPYAWSSVEYSPTLHVSGELDISVETSCIRFCDKIYGRIIFDENSKIKMTSTNGRCIWNTSGSVFIRDNSNVILNSKIAAVTGVDSFIVGNGNNGLTKNNASLKIESNAGNFIETYNGNSERNNQIIFNSDEEIYLKSNSDKEYNAINLSNRADSQSLFYVACKNMIIENAKYFIAASRTLNTSINVTYNYLDNNSKITLKNCLEPLDLSNDNLSTIFASIFNNDTLNIVNN